MRRDDFDAGELEDALGKVQREAVPDARAAVVARDHEFPESQVLHDVHLVLPHAPESVVRVIGPALRLGTVAVAAQVGGDHREVLRQPRRDEMPGDVRQRIAVQQQQRRPLAADAAGDFYLGVRGLNFDLPESLVHGPVKP